MANVTGMLADWRTARYRAYCWRQERSVVVKLLMALGMAGLTGLMAQVRFVLPFTDIPITGQTFPALMAGVVLGGVFGGLSQVFYVALGMAGVPWFQGMKAGPAVLLGPTAGYLLGFILVAALIGRVSDRWVGARSLRSQLVLMALGSAVILFCGWCHLAFLLGRGPTAAFLTGVAPFLAGDAVKAVGAACTGNALLPKGPLGKGQGRSTTPSSTGKWRF